MRSTTTYAMRFAKTELCKSEAWTLFEVITPELGDEMWTPLAAFNLDSAAVRFMGHLFIAQGQGKGVPLITIPATQQRHFESEMRLNITHPR